MSNDNSNTLFDFKFYELENRHKDKPFLRQPFGDSWEEYSYGEVGMQARKLAAPLDLILVQKKFHKK